MQCVCAQGGQYLLCHSYISEQELQFSNDKDSFRLRNWKLSTYINCLASHGFLIERVVEESAYQEKEADQFQEGKFYSAGKARLINSAFIIKAKKI